MGGYDRDKAYAVTGMDPDQYNVVCAIAMGYMGDPSDLPGDLKTRETPSLRKTIAEFIFEGEKA